MLLQEKIERETEALLGETARAVMTGRATVGKKLLRRFTLVEVLGVGCPACNQDDHAKRQQTRPQCPQRPHVQRHTHAIPLRRTMTVPDMSDDLGRNLFMPLPGARHIQWPRSCCARWRCLCPQCQTPCRGQRRCG